MSAQHTPRGHLHVEAFCLMWYACKCGHQERIWNSRDGVTPFGMGCPSCNADGLSGMSHVRWREDVYAPDHKPARGQRTWVDMTRERAEAYAKARIASAAKHGHVIEEGRIPGLIDSIFHEGTAPDLAVHGYADDIGAAT